MQDRVFTYGTHVPEAPTNRMMNDDVVDVSPPPPVFYHIIISLKRQREMIVSETFHNDRGHGFPFWAVLK